MREVLFKEWLVIVALVALLGLSIFDEEPVLDFTDWSFIQAGSLAACMLIVIFEQIMRARYGQYLYKDFVTLAAPLTFWVWIDNYFKLIVIVVATHTLTPLEVDLIEAVGVYQSMATWVSHEALPSLVLLGTSFFILHQLNLMLSGARLVTQLAAAAAAAFTLATATAILAWDTLLSGLSSYMQFEDASVFYLQAKSSLSYDQATGVTDQFEWHKDKARPFSFHFEELYFFTLQLYLTLSLALALVVWLLVLADATRAESRGFTYTQLGVVGLWLEHAALAFFGLYLATALAGLRTLAHTPVEFGLFWL